MTAAELLTDLARRGFDLTLEAEGVRVSPSSNLTEGDRAAIRRHKGELVLLLLAAPALAARERHDWSADPDQRRRQWAAADAIDAAFEAGDVTALRQAVAAFLALYVLPTAKLSEADRLAIRAHKVEVLALLNGVGVAADFQLSIRVQAGHPAPPIIRLRRALKTLLRSFGIRLQHVQEIKPAGDVAGDEETPETATRKRG